MYPSGTTKKSSSQPSPGRSNRYGSPPLRSRPGMVCVRSWRLRADQLLEGVVQLRLLVRLEAPEDVRVVEDLLVREDQGVPGERPVGLLENLLGSLHRADVVDVGLDRGLDLGLVDVVDELLGRVGVRSSDGDLHVV